MFKWNSTNANYTIGYTKNVNSRVTSNRKPSGERLPAAAGIKATTDLPHSWTPSKADIIAKTVKRATA